MHSDRGSSRSFMFFGDFPCGGVGSEGTSPSLPTPLLLMAEAIELCMDDQIVQKEVLKSPCRERLRVLVGTRFSCLFSQHNRSVASVGGHFADGFVFSRLCSSIHSLGTVGKPFRERECGQSMTENTQGNCRHCDRKNVLSGGNLDLL